MVVYRVRADSLGTSIFTSHPVEYAVLSRCSREPADICLRLVLVPVRLTYESAVLS